jgi:hypothetical protein
MSDFGIGFGAVGNGNNVFGPVLSLAPSRALLRAASRSRLLAGAGAAAGLTSRRGPNTSSADFDGVGEPGVAAGARSFAGAVVVAGVDDDGAGVKLRSAGVVVAGGEEVVFGTVLGAVVAGEGATFGTTVGGT